MSDEQDKIPIDEITQRLSVSTGETEETAKEFIHTLFETIGEALITEERVPIYQFGAFKKSFIDAREGRDPNTGEAITIPSHHRIYFTPSESLADAVNKKYSHLRAYDVPDETGIEDPSAEEETPVVMEIPASEGLIVPPEETVSEETVLSEEHKSEDAQPVETNEMEALIGPEKSNKDGRTGKRRALLAVIISGVIAVCLALFLIFWFGIRSPEPLETAQKESSEEQLESVATEPVETAEIESAEQKEVEQKEIEKEVVEGTVPQETEAKERELVSRHTVQRGDTFVVLAEEYWGDKYWWPVLYLDNRENYPNPNRLYPGQRIEIYDAPFSPDTKDSNMNIDALLEAYVSMYHVYRDFGEKLIDRGRRENNAYLQRYGYWRLMEARTLIYTGTMFQNDFIDDVQEELRENDYNILKNHFEYYGPFSE